MYSKKLQKVFGILSNLDDEKIIINEVSRQRKEEINKIITDFPSELASVNQDSIYLMNKRIIQSSFNKENIGRKDLFDTIMLQLTLIDSLYSTQMNKRHYGIAELAEVLTIIADGSFECLKEKFLRFLLDEKHSSDIFDFKFKNCGCHHFNKFSNLLTESYGVGKNGKPKGHAISLISKYAYFLTECRFPIYDSVVKEVYPLIWKYLLFTKCPRINTEDLPAYIIAIDCLRKELGNNVSYDSLDIFLWYLGKIKRGNMSGILSVDDYIKYGTSFDIKNVNLNSLPFLKPGSVTFNLFSLAQKI